MKWAEIIAAASSYWGLLALVVLVILAISMAIVKQTHLFTRVGKKSTFSIFNRILTGIFVIAVLLILKSLIETSGEQLAKIIKVTTSSTKEGTSTTIKFDEGSLIGQVSPTHIDSHPSLESTLQATFSGSITNLDARSIAIKNIEAIRTSDGKTLTGFAFEFKQEAILPNKLYEFKGSAAVSKDLFEGVIRPFDLSFRVSTNNGDIVLPSEVYNLNADAAVAARLFRTNRAKIRDVEGKVMVLNCEKKAEDHLCDRLIEHLY